MDFNLLGTVSGFLVCSTVVVVTVFRQRRFEAADLGAFGAAFLAGTNLPAAVFLCAYAIWPDPVSVPTKLHGMERFVSFAGVSLLLVSLVSIWGLCRKAYEVVLPGGPQTAGSPSTG
jgi:hypothetical protein